MMETNSNANVAATQYPFASTAAESERPIFARADTTIATTATAATISAMTRSQERALLERIFISSQEVAATKSLRDAPRYLETVRLLHASASVFDQRDLGRLLRSSRRDRG